MTKPRKYHAPLVLTLETYWNTRTLLDDQILRLEKSEKGETAGCIAFREMRDELKKWEENFPPERREDAPVDRSRSNGDHADN